MTLGSEVLGVDVVLEIAQRRPVVPVDRVPRPNPGADPVQHHERRSHRSLLRDLTPSAQRPDLLGQGVELMADVRQLRLHGESADEVGNGGRLGGALWVEPQHVVEASVGCAQHAESLLTGVPRQLGR